jgi:flagellar hook-length control protein FliK
MLNIDSALPSDSASGVQVDTGTSQPQDGTFSLALDAEYEKMLVSADSETEAPPAAPEKKEAGKSEEDSSLATISLLGWTQPLWQNLPGIAGEQLPGKETARSPIPEQATTSPDYIVAAANQPMANAGLLAEPTAKETPEATGNADSAIGTGPVGDVPPQQKHASSAPQPDKAVEEQSGSTKGLPFDTPDRLRLEATVSIVHTADNPKPAGSNQPEASLQKEVDPVGSGPSVPLASVETTASNGDVQDQQSQGSKHNNPEINIPRRPVEPEEEQRAVHLMYEPGPETQLPSDPHGPVSRHDTGEIVPAGSSKTTETPGAPQSVWNQIEESNVISQIVAKARGYQWEKNSEIVISLKPESLGRISLRASIVDQTVVATIVTESDKVKNLIELEMPALHHALHENGMPVRVVVVQGSDLSFSNTAGNGQSHQHQHPSFQHSNGSPDPWAPPIGDRNDAGLNEPPDIIDSRYRSRSIHLIA